MKAMRPRFILILLCSLACFADQKPDTKVGTIDPGEVSNGSYRNASFGFTYRLPYGWVERTSDINEDSGGAGKSKVLLATFERPPQAAGTTVNSAVVIATEPASNYPGLTNAAQYFGPLTEVSTANGLKPINEAYEFPVDGKPIIRRDFSKFVANGSMHQSTLALLARGYIVSFTFIAGSDDEITALIEGLAFGKARAGKPGSN